MSEYPIKSPRKLIEVALPLDAINEACAREKSIRHGHPSTLHLWWARRPLAAARAVIFAQLVNDPGYQQGGGFKYGKNKKEAAIERKRLFKIIEDLVLWENTTNEEVLERARAEIRRSWREVCELNKDHPQAAELFNPDKMPGLHDPFAGGGAIPLEAQRLGLESYASDLNPVAVLINKAMIEIPPKFSGKPPVNPEARKNKELIGKEWTGSEGLAEDVRYYGAWMREEAQKRIGHLYPPVEITADMVKYRPDLKPLVGQKLTVIAWIWARTVKSPNPAFSHVDVPLASSFILSSKEGKEAFVEPIVNGESYMFTVRVGDLPIEVKNGTKEPGHGANFRCIVSDAAISGNYIKTEGRAGKMGARLMAIVADGPKGRVFLAPTEAMEATANNAEPTWRPDMPISGTSQYLGCMPYGMTTFGALFSPRQLVALTTFTDIVAELRGKILDNSKAAGFSADEKTLDAGGSGAQAYADAISMYLAFLVSQVANHSATICGWNHPNTQMRSVFSRQALSMTWDYAEANIFSESSGSYHNLFERQIKGFQSLGIGRCGVAIQADAQTQEFSKDKVISSDPPYYDNIPYADLSDFFYVWLRRTLKVTFPSLFPTISVPKTEELVAFAYRHASKEAASRFFLDGMTRAMKSMAVNAHRAFPITLYYAFKQSDSQEVEGTFSTGWDTFLAAVIESGLSVVGTWPMRTEKEGRSRGNDSNALASSIVLVCRKRPSDAPSISRREFIRELNGVLPEALDEMTKGSGDERSPVAPVDLSQAIIGPGMAVFSKYAAVLEADGSPMSVRTALQLINRFLAEDDFDADTQFCLHWFEQHNWGEGVFGTADTLARGKGTSVDGIKDAGVIQSGSGKVRLLKWSEYPTDWDPSTDKRTPVWEALHHLIRALKSSGGEGGAGAMFAALGGKAEAVRQLAYRLYTLCEREGRAEDARAYNELITSWTAIEAAASAAPKLGEQQLPGFESRG